MLNKFGAYLLDKLFIKPLLKWASTLPALYQAWASKQKKLKKQKEDLDKLNSVINNPDVTLVEREKAFSDFINSKN